jgi:hypothetical protein
MLTDFGLGMGAMEKEQRKSKGARSDVADGNRAAGL